MQKYECRVSTVAFTFLIAPIVAGWAAALVEWLGEVSERSRPSRPGAMRTLSTMVAALSLGACAALPPTRTDIAAQIRSNFGADKQSCAGQSLTSPGRDHLAQAKRLTANPVAQSRASVQAAETRTKQRIVNDHPPSFNLASASETVVEAIPTLNSEASCHLADNLAVDQNVNHCLALESGARNQLARRWAEFPSADRSHCIRYSSAGGGGTYTDLLSCLETEADARKLHAKSRSAANQ